MQPRIFKAPGEITQRADLECDMPGGIYGRSVVTASHAVTRSFKRVRGVCSDGNSRSIRKGNVMPETDTSTRDDR
jgi:hypothetical protein